MYYMINESIKLEYRYNVNEVILIDREDGDIILLDKESIEYILKIINR